jgi:PIN domain nuclease of toxin-antitoxin system
MRLLLDTQAFIWFVDGNTKMSMTARRYVADPANEVLMSIASAWEIAIKVGIKKLSLSEPVDRYLTHRPAANRISILPISIAHVLVAGAFPLQHRDPFDRMFCAQSIVEGTPLVSSDSMLDVYGVNRIW